MIKEKYIMSNTIKISLSNPKSTAFKKKEFIFYHKIKEVVKLIDSRIDEIEKEEDKEKNPLIRFKNLRMHDAILIDGKRGSGKTTYLHNIEKVLEKKRHKSKVKVLGAIDPNQLDEKSNILLIIIANIYTELLDSVKNDNGDKELFKSLNIEINNLTSSIRTAEDRIYTDSYDHLYGLHKNLTIDEELHSFFLQVCDFYGVKALILPIDDIDMDFKHGYKVLDTIRKYLSTPKIIPIIAVDTAQAYALVKKEHYEYFSYNAKTEKGDIAQGSELGFLRKLPNEYLQKILKPTRRVMLPDMLDIYKSHLRAKKNGKSITNKVDKKVIFTYKKKNLNFEMEFDVLLAKYMNVTYGFGGENIDNPDYYRVVNYLKNKSLRSFFEDMIAFLNGFSSKGNDDYQFDIEPLKERLIPNYMVKFHNKYDATEWVWDYYIDKLEKIIQDYKNRWKDIRETQIFVNILKNMMIIDSKELHIRSRNEKSYARIFMQDFFIEEIKIIGIKHDTEVITDFDIVKTFNLGGIIELMLRTFVPMSIFETLVNNRTIDIFNFNIEEFRQFEKDDISSDIKSSMHNISIWPMKYGYREKYKEKLIGIEIANVNKNEHEKYGILADRTSSDREQKYYISPLKYFAYLSEFLKLTVADTDDKKIQLQKYYNDIYRIEEPSIKNKVKSLNEINFHMKFKNSNLGILPIVKFSKHLTKNILEVTLPNIDISNLKKSNLNTINKNEYYSRLIDKNISNYKIQFYHHLLIFIYKNTFKSYNDMNISEDLIYVGSRKDDFYKYKNQENKLITNIHIIQKYQDKVIKDKNVYMYLLKYMNYLEEYILEDESYQNSFFKEVNIYDDKYNYLQFLLSNNQYKILINFIHLLYVDDEREVLTSLNEFFIYLNLHKNKEDEEIGKLIEDFISNSNNKIDLQSFLKFLKDPENATK